MKPFSSETHSPASGLFRKLADVNLLLLSALVALVAPPLPSKADTATINGIKWTYYHHIGDAFEWDGTLVINDGSFGVPAIPNTTGGSIVVPSTINGASVVYIGSSAFRDCAELTSITIPASVRSIASDAFRGCTSLRSIFVSEDNPAFTSRNGSLFTKDGTTLLARPEGRTSFSIPDGTKSIGEYVFCDCQTLSSLSIPSSVTNIGAFSFAGCKNLSTIVIPNSVVAIGPGAFEDCVSLSSVSIPESVTYLMGTFSGCSSLTSVNIPSSVRHIGGATFEGCSGLTSITIPNSVKSIGSMAFKGCRGLTSLTIPDSVTTIDSFAFERCTGLTSVSIPDSLQSINTQAFRDCTGLDSVHIHDIKAWCEIEFEDHYANPLYHARHLYLNGTEVKSLTVPDNTTRIKRFVFSRCEGLSSVRIPGSVREININAFSGCNELVSFEVDVGNPAYSSQNGLLLSKDGKTVLIGVNGDVTIPDGVVSMGGGAFGQCGGLASITIPDCMTDLGGWTFEGCTGLTSVTIPTSIKEIGHRVFMGCSGLTSVTIPNSVTRIQSCAFIGCRGLTSVTIPSGITCLENQVFAGCSSLTSITIPQSVSSIEECVFEGCSSLTSITIPKGVTSIGSGVFAGCNDLQFIAVEPGNSAYLARGGALLTKDGRILLAVPGARSSYEVPSGVTKIDGIVFRGNSRLTSVTIPNGVKSIGRFAFSGCTALKAVTIPGSVSSIDMGLFDGCTQLESVTIQDGVKRIGDEAFWRCSSLTSVTIPSSVTSIDDNAFAYCGALTSLTIPNSVTSVGWDAFAGSGLKELIVPASWKGTDMLSEAEVPSGCKIVYAVFDYTVKYNANGGMLPKGKSMAPQKMTCGKTVKLRKNVFTRKGYLFLGWAKTPDGAVAYKNGAEVLNLRTDGKTTTLYAKWAKESYTVAFDANGGKGKMAAQKMAFGKAANLAKNAFARKGWLFLGWATSKANADKGAVAYKDGAAVKNLRTDGKTTTLYAVWEKAQTVKFDANGGTCAVADKDFKVGKAYGSFPTPERKWYTFLGWFTAADGGEWVAETDIAETAAARTLFAHWEYIPVRLGETSKTVGPDAAEKLSVALSAKADWTATADAAWIAVRTKSGPSGSGSLVFDVAKNAGAARTGRIIVSAGGKAVVLTVSQKARTLTLSGSNKVFKAAAAKGQKLGVTATVAWTAKSSAKWLKVKTAKGKGNGTVVYELAANKGAGRAATITVSGGGKTATFRVEQKGPDGSEPVAEIPSPTHYLTIDPTWQTYAAGKATNEMAFVESDLSWTATTKESWIVLDSNAKAGSGDGILRYSVEANTGLARTGTVSVAASGLKATLTIEQAAKETPLYLYVMPTTRTATAAAAAKESIWVEANVAWMAGSGDDWIDVKTLSGTGSGGLSYSMAANTATTNRTGTITLFGGGLSAEFTLTQEGRKAGSTAPDEPDPPVAKYLRVNPTAREHGDAAQTGSFLVEANIPWTVTVSANWIVLHTRSGANNGAVSYSLAKNTGDTRTGFITVSGNGVPPATFTVVQKGKGGGVDPIPGPTPGPTPTPTPTPTPVSKWIKINGATQANVVVPAAGGQTAVYVTTKPLDMQWGVRTSQPSWIHLETVGGIGSGAVSFHVDPNPSKSKRSGTITVWSGSKSARCKVVQEGKVPYLKVSPTQFADIPWKGQNGLSVLVRSNVDWSVSASPGIRLHTSGGTGDGTITFDVSKNPDYKERTLTMTVSGVDVKPITVVIIQEKATLLKVSPTSRSFSHEKAGGSLSVTANVKWQATSSASWITLTRASGNGNGIITFTVSKNTTGKKRVGTITVTGGGKTVTVTITQNAAPYLKVSPTSKTVPFNAASYQLSVTANVSWKAKSGATWISLTTASGKGDGTIVFKVSKNTTGKKRVGTITVTGGGLSRKATITQKKEPKLSISPTKMTIDSDAVYSWFYVTSDVDWTAKTDSDWVKLRTASGKGNGIKNGGYVDFDAEENKGAKTRTAKITVTGGGKSVAFTLTQKGRSNLCFYQPDGWPAAVFVTDYQTSTSGQTTFDADKYPPPCIRFAWANVGDSDTGSYTVKALITEPNGTSGIWLENRAKLSVNKYDYAHFYWGLSNGYAAYAAPTDLGTYTVKITLDSGKTVTESNEKDNTATVYFTVVSTGSSYSYAAPPPVEFADVEPEAPVIVEEPAKAKWVVVVASGGEDAGAVADGDEETSWTPDAADGAWCVLTFPEPVDATNAELVGDGLPEGTRILFSEDSENWHEELPARVQYVWAVFPASGEPFDVREIRLLSK